MQNSQEIYWLFEAAKFIVPSLITGIVGFWLSRKMADYQNNFSTDLKSYESALNRRLEDYKKDISKELEMYKIHLQSEFQTGLYTFQTKFSLWHQRQEEITVETFEKLAELFNLFQKLANWDVLYGSIYSDGESEALLENCFNETQKHLNLFADYYDRKRIFLDEIVQKDAYNIYQWGIRFMKIDLFNGENVRAKMVVDNEMLPSLNRIEKRFKDIFSANSSTLKSKNDNS